MQWCSILFLPYYNIIIPIIISQHRQLKNLKPYSTSPYPPSNPPPSLYLEESWVLRKLKSIFTRTTYCITFVTKPCPVWVALLEGKTWGTCLVYEPSIFFKWVWLRNVCPLSATCLYGLSSYRKLWFLHSDGIKTKPNTTTESPLSVLLQSWMLLSHVAVYECCPSGTTPAFFRAPFSGWLTYWGKPEVQDPVRTSHRGFPKGLLINSSPMVWKPQLGLSWVLRYRWELEFSAFMEMGP